VQCLQITGISCICKEMFVNVIYNCWICIKIDYWILKTIKYFIKLLMKNFSILRLHQMHEMQTVVTDDRDVCLSESVCHAAHSLGHLVQPLPHDTGLFLWQVLLVHTKICNISEKLFCRDAWETFCKPFVLESKWAIYSPCWIAKVSRSIIIFCNMFANLHHFSYT